MSQSIAYSDLLRPEDVKLKAINSLGIDVTDNATVDGIGDSYQQVCIDAIKDVTSAVECYLDRKLMVRKWTIDIPGYKWEDNGALEKLQHYPKHWPIVQVETSGVTISNDEVRLLAGNRKDEVTFYAGYRRHDQTVGDGENSDIDTAANGLDGLTATPDELPGDIRRVAFRLVMYELTMAQQNTFATGSVTKQTGQMTAEVTRARQDVYDEELSKLHSHRRIL